MKVYSEDAQASNIFGTDKEASHNIHTHCLDSVCLPDKAERVRKSNTSKTRIMSANYKRAYTIYASVGNLANRCHEC